MKQSYLIIYNAITNYGRALIQGLVSFLLVPFIVRYIGSDSYGVVLLAIAAYGMIMLLGMGLSKAVIKYFAQERAKEKIDLINVIFNSSLLWFFIIGLFGSIVTFFLGLYFDSIFNKISLSLVEQGRLSMYIISITIVPCVVLDVFKGILSGEQRYDIVNFIGTTSAVLRALVIVAYFLLVKPSLIAVVIVFSVFYIVERIGYVIASYKIIDTIKLSFSFINMYGLKMIIGFASMMLIATTANMLAGHVFKFIIGAKLSLKDLTYYGVLLLLTTTANLLVRSFVNVLVPVASKYQSLGDHATIRKLLIHGTKYAVIIILALNCITIPFLKSLLYLWMGPEFVHIWPVGIILFVGQILSSSSVTANQILSGIGKVKVIAFSAFTSVAVGLGLSLIYLEFWQGAILFFAVLLLNIQRVINTLIIISYSIKTILIDKRAILRNAYLFPLIISMVVLLIGLVLTNFINIENWASLILSVIIIEIFYFIMIYFFSLDIEEKTLFKKLLGKGLNRIHLARNI